MGKEILYILLWAAVTQEGDQLVGWWFDSCSKYKCVNAE